MINLLLIKFRLIDGCCTTLFPPTVCVFPLQIQLSWNYNYIDASAALGLGDALCTNPDLVATDGQIAWGTGKYDINDAASRSYWDIIQT